MIHQSTQRQVIDKLVESLGSAKRGSRELDIVVCFALGETSSDAGQMIQLLVEEGYPWEVVSELLDAELPPYTTSLDAALPGENIVLALHSSKRNRWAAAHKTRAGKQVLTWAANECLARRRAALRGLSAALLARRASKPAATPKPPPKPPPKAAPPKPTSATPADAPTRGWSRPAQSEAVDRDDTDGGEEEWKILF